MGKGHAEAFTPTAILPLAANAGQMPDKMPANAGQILPRRG